MQKWEYTTQTVYSDDEHSLNHLGEDGWEGFAAARDDSTPDGEAQFIIFLKRPKS